MSSKLKPPKGARAKQIAMPESKFKEMAAELIRLRQENQQLREELANRPPVKKSKVILLNEI